MFYLEIPPFLFARVVKGLAEAGLTTVGRVVVEKPFGHDLESAKALAAELHQYVDESQLLPDRPLPREDGLRGDPLPALRQHDPRAAVEPQLRGVRGDHDGRGLRREDRGHFYDPVGALRDVVVNHLMQVVAAAAMEPPSGPGSRGAAGRAGRAVPLGQGRRPRPLRAWPVRRLPRRRRASPRTRRPRRTPRCGSRSTTGAGRASRSTSAPASGCRRPQTEVRVVFREPPPVHLGLGAGDGRQPVRDEFVVKLDPTTGARLIVDAHRGDGTGAARDHPRRRVRRRGRRGPHAVRGAAAAALVGATPAASSGRTSSRRAGGSCSR